MKEAQAGTELRVPRASEHFGAIAVQEMGLGPPPEPKPWWEKRDAAWQVAPAGSTQHVVAEADSDEEPERRGIGYLPAHHPNW